MQNYLLAVFALSAGLINLFWKEKGKWFSLFILVGVAVVSLWKEIAAKDAAQEAKEEQRQQDELRARLTGELLSSYHKLDHLLFMVDLNSEAMPDGDYSYEKAEAYYPFPRIGSVQTDNLWMHLVVNNDSVDIRMIKLSDDSASVRVNGNAPYKIDLRGFAEGGSGSHDLFKEMLPGECTYGIHFPTDIPELPMPLTLPAFLQSMSKEKQIGFFEYELPGAISDDQIKTLTAGLQENLFINFKGYVTDNDSLGNQAVEGMSDVGFRPNLYVTMKTGEPQQSGNKLRIPIIVAQYPKLSFTEVVPL